MALATPNDVAVPLLRQLSAEEVAYANRLLDWAEALIRAAAIRRGTTIDALDVQSVIMVEAQAVARVLRNPDGAYQESLSGEYSATRDRLNADGVLRIADDEWALLFPASPGGAFTIDTAPKPIGIHSPICALAFGAAYCSCGADIAGTPIFEPLDV